MPPIAGGIDIERMKRYTLNAPTTPDNVPV